MKDDSSLKLRREVTASGAVWRWQRGDYFSQTFETELQAQEAEEDCVLEYSRADNGDALLDLYQRKEVETGYSGHYDYWLVADCFVCEPILGGYQLGELPEYQIPSSARVLRMTQTEFDALLEDHYMQYGYYPGQ